MMQFGNSENAIKRLEEENQNLKKRLEEKTEQYLKVWERDFHFGILIDDVLEKPELKHALKVLNIIKQGLDVPDDFKAPTVNKEEVEHLTKEIDKLTKEVEHLRIDKQNNDIKSLEFDNNVKNLNSEIADLKAECKKAEKELADLKPYYEKKMTELMWKNDKLTEEKEFRKFQLKKHQENSILVNKENDKENQSQDKVQKLLIDIARLEGKLLNKDKELKVVWEKVEFYRNQLNK
jgi:chromosome segregation ATPase